MRERTWLIIVIIVAGVATRFMWLSYPREAVFDEVHFGKFVTAYCCTGERFFDIHPPHAKLLAAGAAWMAGYRGGLPFSHIGQSYGDAPVWGFRLVPAVMGVLLPLVLFGLWRQLGASRAAAFFGALVAVFDNALTAQSRVISLDGVLLVATFGAWSAYLWAERGIEEKTGGWRRWVVGSLLAGVLAGLAVGAKFTGLAVVGLIGLILCWRMFRAVTYKMLARYLAIGLLIAVSGGVVYGAGWALHFALLPLPGSGDAWRVPRWGGFILTDFARETKELHRIMYDANYNLTATHPDASVWWSWPLMRTSVFYWVYGGGDGRTGSIYFLGNPAVWWGTSALFVMVLVFLVLEKLRQYSSSLLARRVPPSLKLRRAGLSRWRLSGPRYSSASSLLAKLGVSLLRIPPGRKPFHRATRHWPSYWIPLLGYFIAYVPLTRVPRALFLYHYLMPLLFALVAGVLWLDGQGFFRPGSVLKQPRYYFVLLGAVIALFVVFSPLTYGFLLPRELHDMLFWLDTWR